MTVVVESEATTTIAFDKLKTNPEYEKYAYEKFPLTQEEYNTLKADIANSKIRSPLTINSSGFILDGHHRYKIARELEIKEIPVIVENFASFLDELSFVVKVNALRRQLNDYQKATVAFALESLQAQKARQSQLSKLKNQDKFTETVNNPWLAPIGANDNDNGDNNNSVNNSTGTSASKSAHMAAQSVGMSTRTYERAKFVIQHGDQKMKETLTSGKISINFAEKTIRNKQIKRQKIDQLVKQANEGNISTAKYELFVGNFIDQQLNIPDNCIDLIFTDPPYNQENIPLYKDLGDMAFRVLKEGGSLLCYAGHYALPEISKLMESSGLRYWWIISVVHNGHITRMHKQKVWPHWKPILWFVKQTNNSPNDIGDLIQSEPTDKSLHDWQQSTVEAEYCIKHLTVDNQTVLDPFMGSGTTGIAALKLNRRFIGIEIDPNVMDVASAVLSSKAIENNGSLVSVPKTIR